MAYRQDYILRMMEMMAEMIALFLGLIKKGDLQQANKRLNNAYRDFLKKDAAFFHQLPLDNLTTELLQKHDYTHDHLKVLSELFFAEAELLLAQNKSAEALVFYKKALILLDYTEKQSLNFSITNIGRRNTLNERITTIASR